jgi:hypothetical protein
VPDANNTNAKAYPAPPLGLGRLEWQNTALVGPFRDICLNVELLAKDWLTNFMVTSSPCCYSSYDWGGLGPCKRFRNTSRMPLSAVKRRLKRQTSN